MTERRPNRILAGGLRVKAAAQQSVLKCVILGPFCVGRVFPGVSLWRQCPGKPDGVIPGGQNAKVFGRRACPHASALGFVRVDPEPDEGGGRKGKIFAGGGFSAAIKSLDETKRTRFFDLPEP